MRNLTFKKRLLTRSIAVVVASGMSYQAFAADEAVDEVVVTGIKASIQNAVNIKREAAGVVDAISAEDIGKMPDANLAESLQRITGISIDRTNGEGSRITARGFGPEFNLVTINGRQLSSASIGEGGDPDSSRSFDMSNIASESVSGVEVYKTGRASNPTGGIGATVNLKTAKPFDHEGFKASAGIKALNDRTVDTDVSKAITPEISGFASWSNEMFGASLSVTHQERNSARSGYSNSGWGDKAMRYAGPGIFNNSNAKNTVSINEPVAAIDGVPKSGDKVSRLQEASFFHTDTTRKRDNALLTLQFKPTDNIVTTLDYLTTTTKTRSQQSIYSLWFSDFATRKVQWDNSPIMKTPLYEWQQPDSGVRDIALKNHLNTAQNKLDDLGFNTAIEVSDQLSFDVDVHHSKSSATPWGEPGSRISLGIGVNTLAGQGMDMTGSMPLLVGVIQHKDANGNVTYDNKITKSDVGSTISQLNNARVWADIKEAKVTGKYKFADSGSIDFGIDKLKTESIQRKSEIGNQTMRGNWSVNAPGDINPNWYDLVDYSKYFDGYNTGLTASAKNFLKDAGPVDAKGNYLAANAGVIMTGVRVKYFDVVGKAMFADAPKNADGTQPQFKANPVDNVDRKINEDISAAFVQTSLDGELGDMKVNLTAGLRYESTDVDSAARIAPKVMRWTADRDFDNKALSGTAGLPYTISSFHYNNVLPSLDLTFHVTDDLIARASSSKTISRPNYGDLQQGSWGNPPKGNPILAGGLPGDNNDGNVKLKPIESNNIDLSVEYYFSKTDYVSLGFFDKRVPNFIGYSQEKTYYAAAKDPSNGPRAVAAVAELNKRGIAVNEQNLFRMVASMNDTTRGCENMNAKNLCGKPYDSATYTEWSAGVDIVPLAEDPGSWNNTRKALNANDARLYGWEIAGQHFFGETGFGLQANYTIVNGTTNYNLGAEPQDNTQFALPGLGNSANLVAMYEKDAISARVAYNWRDTYLNNPNAGGNEPEYVKAYGQVDFNVGYKITEDFTVSLEGTNVLSRDKKSFGRTENQVKYIDILSPRYALSARYNF